MLKSVPVITTIIVYTNNQHRHVWVSTSQRIPLFWHKTHIKGLRARFPTRLETEERQGRRAVDREELVTVRERQLLKEDWDLWTQRPGWPVQEDESAFPVAVWEFRSHTRP